MLVCGWYEFPCVGWFWGVTIGKLHQAGTVLFRCPKIRKSKYAWFRLRRSDVCVLNVPSGHIRTCAAVHGSTTLYCEQAYKDFLIFSQSHKTDPGLMRFASRKVVNHPSRGNSCHPQTNIYQITQGCEPPLAGKLILQPWGCVNFCDIHFKKVEKSRRNLLYLCF